MRIRTRIRTFLVAVPLLLAGCSGGGEDEVTVSSGVQAGNDAAEPASAVAGLVLPLDAYSLSEDDARAVGEAIEASVRSCFVSYGFAGDAADPLPVGAAGASSAARHERRYAVADASVAARYGYHPPSSGRNFREEFYAAHTDEELHVLGGALENDKQVASEFRGQPLPPGGCVGQAVAEFAPPDEKGRVAGEELVSRIQADAWHQAQRDSRVVDAFAAWSACMAAAGYQYKAPMEANDDPAWQKTAGTQREIATASADVACKEKTSLIDTWSTVEAEVQAELIAKNRGDLEAYRTLLDRQVAVARSASDQ